MQSPGRYKIDRLISAVPSTAYDKQYKVTFSDGRYVTLSGSDTIAVSYYEWSEDRDTNVVALQQLLSIKSKSKSLYVDLKNVCLDAEVELPLDPYLLGALIGDGGMTSRATIFTSADTEILEEVSRLLPRGHKLTKKAGTNYDYLVSKPVEARSNLVTGITRDLGVRVRSEFKSIPDVYMQASASQKLRLINGLMDTDGTACKAGSVSFSSTSPKLARQVQSLIRQLGGIASISEKKPSYTYLGERRAGLLAYNVNIRFKSPSSLFFLPRKRATAKDRNQYSDNLKLRIDSVKEI